MVGAMREQELLRVHVDSQLGSYFSQLGLLLVYYAGCLFEVAHCEIDEVPLEADVDPSKWSEVLVVAQVPAGEALDAQDSHIVEVAGQLLQSAPDVEVEDCLLVVQGGEGQAFVLAAPELYPEEQGGGRLAEVLDAHLQGEQSADAVLVASRRERGEVLEVRVLFAGQLPEGEWPTHQLFEFYYYYQASCFIVVQAVPLFCCPEQGRNSAMIGVKAESPPSYSKHDVVLAKVEDEFPWPATVVLCKGFALNKDLGVVQDYYQVRFFDRDRSWAILFNYQITPLTSKRIASLKQTMKANSKFIYHLKSAQAEIKKQKETLGGILLQRHQRLYENGQPSLPLEDYSKTAQHLLHQIQQQRKASGVAVTTQSQKEQRRKKRFRLCSQQPYIHCTILIALTNGQIVTNCTFNGLVSHSVDQVSGQEDEKDSNSTNEDIADHSNKLREAVAPQAEGEKTIAKESRKGKGKEPISRKPERVAREKIREIIQYIEYSLTNPFSSTSHANYMLAQEQVKVAMDLLAFSENLTRKRLQMFLQDLSQFLKLFDGRLQMIAKRERGKAQLAILPLARVLHWTLAKTIEKIGVDSKAKQMQKSIVNMLVIAMKSSSAKFAAVLQRLQHALAP